MISQIERLLLDDQCAVKKELEIGKLALDDSSCHLIWALCPHDLVLATKKERLSVDDRQIMS